MHIEKNFFPHVFLIAVANLFIVFTSVYAAPSCYDFYNNTGSILNNDPYENHGKLEQAKDSLEKKIYSLISRNDRLNLDLQRPLTELAQFSELLDALQEKILNGEIVGLEEFDSLHSRLSVIHQTVDTSLKKAQEEIAASKGHAIPLIPNKNVVIISKKAEKDIAGLQPLYLDKFREFLQELKTISRLSTISPSWSLEKINMFELVGTKVNTYTVRLNHGYRVLFTFDPIQGATIVRVSKSLTHNN